MIAVENPYLREALALDPGIMNYDPWHREPPGTQVYVESKRLQKRYAWAIPNDAALKAIAAWSPIVEIGAGTGYWASLLAAVGADVIAYDVQPGRNGWCDAAPFFPVQVGDETKAAEHPDRTLFLCWPPYSNDMAERSLRLYRGNRLVYLCEPQQGARSLTMVSIPSKIVFWINTSDLFFTKLLASIAETQDSPETGNTRG